MRQVKAGDTVRIKTAEELENLGKTPNKWSVQTRGLLGTKQTAENVYSDRWIEIGGIRWLPDEYVLLPEIPERGDIVYVSDVSDEDAIKNKVARIFLAYVEGTHRPFITVHELYEDRYKNGETVDIGNWRYAVKKPALQKITKDELPAFLAEHGYELEG